MSDKSGGSFQDSLNDWLVSIIVAVALAFCIRTFIFEPYKVEGTSMYPTLFNQERLIVNKFGYFLDDPKRNEIVVFRYPKDESRDFIKRVLYGLGDSILQPLRVFADTKSHEALFASSRQVDRYVGQLEFHILLQVLQFRDTGSYWSFNRSGFLG